MRWQKAAQVAIAVFVTVFAAVIILTIRQRTATVDAALDIEHPDPEAVLVNTDSGTLEHTKDGTLLWSARFARQLVYPDGRMKLADVTLTLPDRDGRSVEVTAREANLRAPAGGTIGAAEFRRDVKLTTSDGIVIAADEGTYDDSSGLLTIPGPVTFTRGRMQGRGIGATYDRNREILWLLDRAHIIVAPDPAGAGAAEATAGAVGMARADNYLRFTRDARITSDGRTIQGDEVTVLLKEDGETIRQILLRGQSRITGGGSGAQAMSARDIDLAYGDDGRALQSAQLMEDAVVELPGGHRRLAGRTVGMTMAPDGVTLTSLHAVENVQLDLPAEGDAPAKRITAASLRASGAPDVGLQQATFEGPVEYRETRPARPDVPALDRTARALRLILDTKGDLGAIERADFRGNFRFADSANVTAEAPRGLYLVDRQQIELSPSDGDPGPAPSVNDGQIHVTAVNIRLSPPTGELSADTDVRSVFQPRREARQAASARSPDAAPSGSDPRLPALLGQDKPVNVAANRLKYDGTSVATFSGNARLWQDRSKIDADTITLDDSTGNLTARVNVRTTLMLEEVDATTKRRTVAETVGTSDVMTYDEARRLAVYTSDGAKPATLKRAQGVLTGDRIELYLKPAVNELERAEADGTVVVQEGGRRARGSRLVYTAEDDTYVMTGTPVEIVEKEQQACRKARGTTLKFRRSVDSILDSERFPTRWTPTECPAELRF